LNFSLTSVLLRFWLGLIGGTLVGFAVYRFDIFDPLSPAFRILTLGSTAAGILALWRSSARGHATALAAAYALFSLGFVSAYGWFVALSGAVIGAGLVAIAVIFDRLAARVAVGKFLVLGVMFGALMYAVTPMIEFGNLVPLGSIDAMSAYGQLGLVLGVGVGFGVEVSDWILRPRTAPVG
jgi:hypothetical protein